MKIKNDFIKIKIGEKEYEFKNLIFKEYCRRIAEKQIEGIRTTNNSFDLRYLKLQLDEPLTNIDENSIISPNDLIGFSFWGDVNKKIFTSKKANKIIYTYELKYKDLYMEYSEDTGPISIESLEKYEGRKIAGIGFMTWPYETSFLKTKLCAYLDISKENIYIQKNQSILITRQDSFYSDAEFYSNDKKVNYPLHLLPISTIEVFEPIEETVGEFTVSAQIEKAYPKLYSIGFSNNIDKIEKEFILGKDIQAVQEINKIIFNDVENKYNGDYIYPQNNLFAGQNLYPLQEKFKYVIYKYKLIEDKWTGEIEYDEEGYPSYIEEPTDTGLYYLQAKEIDLPENKNVDLILSYDRI